MFEILGLAALAGIASWLTGEESPPSSSESSDSSDTQRASTSATTRRYSSSTGLPEFAPGAGIDVAGNVMDMPPSHQ